MGRGIKGEGLLDRRTSTTYNCSVSKTKLQPGGTDTNKNGDYKHTPELLYAMWTGLLVYFLLCFILTVVFVARQKGE